VIDFPATAHRIASSALTADLAIKADPDDVDSAFARMTSLRDELASLLALLFGSTTSMRLVAEPSAYSIDRVVRAAGALALQGVDVDGIIVNRCARKSDPVPLREEHEALLGGVALSADGPLVWKATGRVRAVPKGRSAMGPLGSSRVLGEHTLGIVSDDEGFDLHVPLTGAARAGTRVGRFEDSLVVEFDGAIRWLALPSVLRRCRPLEASRGTEGLHVRFVPDPALWREDLPTGGAA
jgi:arsenite-transporting ATPase